MERTGAPHSSSLREEENEQTAMDCVVLISSWDGYSDLWKPFLHLFRKYWPDCPFPVALTANEKSCDDPEVMMLRFDKIFDWSTGLLVCLEQIKEEYVIVMLEDFFLRTPINNEDIINSLRFLHEHGGHSLKLIPNPAPDQRVSWGGKDYYGAFSIGRPYRVNLQGAIWRRKTLERIVQRGETAWQFEMRGTQRAEAIKSGFYGVYVPLLTYGHHVVEKGKWFRQEAACWGDREIGCDFSAREIMSSKEMLIWRYRKTINIVKRVVKSFFYTVGILNE